MFGFLGLFFFFGVCFDFLFLAICGFVIFVCLFVGFFGVNLCYF